jgi:glutathione synthase/RimK-type ligase-like ATP-grasp enzyme
MDKPNSERVLISIIRELATELNYKAEFLSHNWVVRVIKENSIRHIMGYDWELNSSASQLIAKDKSACYEVLSLSGVPAIEHQLFLSPQFQNYIGKNGSWKGLLSYAEKHKYNVVCKSNTGTGGNEVFKITSQLELETAVHTLFAKYRGICLCPFYDIDTEYRVIVLNGVVQLVYAKQKPRLTGDGTRTVLELLKDEFDQFDAVEYNLTQEKLRQVLFKNEILELSWKHNLGKGAKPIMIHDEKLKIRLNDLALQAAAAININFGSIDIAASGDDLLVMEINSGVMMENFAQASDENFQLAKSIYKNALVAMLG